MIRAYEVIPWGEAEYAHVEHAESAGKARYLAWLHFRDGNDAIRITDLKVRSLGAPRTSPRLERVALYRGRPELGHAGTRVVACGKPATVIDADDGANFVLAFDDGTRGSVHHGDIAPFPAPSESPDAGAGS